MSQEFVTINQERGGHKVPVSIPSAEFADMYQKDTIRLKDISQYYGITIPGVRIVAQKLKLPPKAQNWTFKPKYNNIDLPRLRQLLEFDRVTFTEAAAIMGISEYLVSRAVAEFDIKALYRRKANYKHKDCIPVNGRKPCEFLPVCRELEPSGEPLHCEELLEDELPMKYFERDSAPSIGYGVVPFCSLMR